MKIAAVIAEYNPFHNGHLYQLQSLHDKLNADYIIIVMSGDFTQRGIPAIVDKYDRCRMALEQGADLVIELPVYFALGSAEYFAQGAVALLDKLGVVDMLHFGSECGNITQLTKCAHILAYETPEYKRLLNQYLRQGLSYPAARSQAFNSLFAADQTTQPITSKPIAAAQPANNFLPAYDNKTTAHNSAAINYSQILSNPNNNLAIEYIKALTQRKSRIIPATIERKGSPYNVSTLTSGTFASADALRRALFGLQKNVFSANPCCQAISNIHTLKEYLPESIFYYFKTLLDSQYSSLLFADDFSELLHYKLIHEQNQNITQGKRCFSSFYDVNEQLSNTLYKHLPDYDHLSDFALSCKSKNLTYTHINRCLMHILLDMKQDTIDALKACDYSQYARLLGFCESGRHLFKAIKANSSIPFITKPSKAAKELHGMAQESFYADIYASTIYQSVKFRKMTDMSEWNGTKKMPNEWKRQLIKVP